MSEAKETKSLTMPSNVLVDCLAGKTTLGKSFPDSPGHALLSCIEEGRQVVGCLFEGATIEQALSSRVTLILARPPERVYFGP